ncbi:hemerythrin domain-containing protein [Thermoactinospora rubra]|uniref:hemerythrin domain-containing protein n=1 Tax=Thermoactinospora rubra TaxID=1088767 RepID=UPI000A11498F|nr:hemerythrin domain-containing protein [Thermoactinospora rubra]
MPDVVKLITSDHREIEALFARLRDRPHNRRADLVKLAALLTAHARAEEDRVYPELRKAVPAGDGDVHHGFEEHKEAEVILDRLKSAEPGGAEFDRTLKRLVQSVSRHIKEEENEMLPALGRAVGRKRLQELGKAFKERRDQELAALMMPVQARRGSASLQSMSKAELYRRAQDADLPGRSRMSKEELADALRRRG